MALIQCPECDTTVSSKALTCRGCGLQLRTPRRGVFGMLCLILFLAFNALMVLWLGKYWVSIAELSAGAGSDAGQAGTAIGATIGTGLILTFWALGDVVLGILTLLTRPR